MCFFYYNFSPLCFGSAVGGSAPNGVRGFTGHPTHGLGGMGDPQKEPSGPCGNGDGGPRRQKIRRTGHGGPVVGLGSACKEKMLTTGDRTKTNG